MKGNETISRRGFLSAYGMLAGASMLRTSVPAVAAIAQAACSARDAGATFTTLGADEAADFAAVAARLIPTTDTPGASEAGVIHFYDRAWGDELAWALESMRGLLETLNRAAGTRFSTLGHDDQDALLRAHENDGRFELLRLTTVFGFFAMDKYGGNRDHVSWTLIGFDGHHVAWHPPFGHYDAEHAKERADDE